MTKITQEQYDTIKDALPGVHGKAGVSNVAFLNAILHLTESGGPWRHVSKKFGNWHIIYVRMQHWADNGVWPRVQEVLKSKLDISLDITVLSQRGSAFEEYPDGTLILQRNDFNHEGTKDTKKCGDAEK